MQRWDGRAVGEILPERLRDPAVLQEVTAGILALPKTADRREALSALVDRLLAADDVIAAEHAARLTSRLSPPDQVNDVDPWLGNALLLRVVDALGERGDRAAALRLLDEVADGLTELARYEPSDLPRHPPWRQVTERCRRLGVPERADVVRATVAAWARSIMRAPVVPDPAWFQPEDGSRFLLDVVADMVGAGRDDHDLVDASVDRNGVGSYRANLLAAAGEQLAERGRERVRDAGGAALELWELVRAELVSLLEGLDGPGAGAVTPDDRVRAGQALGLLGDPRVPVRDEEWQASFEALTTSFVADGAHYWRYVPAGEHVVGGWADLDPYAGPMQPDQLTELLALQGFWIARLPVTVDQFTRFVHEAYGDDAFWTPHGRAWRDAEAWAAGAGRGEAAYLGANQPVVQVSWYEADAYCRWLRSRWREALPAGHEICLPPEAHWEAASTYDGSGRRRPHPWGTATPTTERAATSAWRGAAAAPVGLCPAGAAACGALDLVGGAREWSGSAAESYPRRAQVRVADHEPARDIGPLSAVVRGVGWREQPGTSSSGARDATRPQTRLADLGFRLALLPTQEPAGQRPGGSTSGPTSGHTSGPTTG